MEIEISEEVYTALEEICNKHNLSINDLFHRLVTYPEITENALRLPQEISNEMAVATQTLQNKLPLWLNNMRKNFDAIKTNKDITDIPKSNTPALVIGAGPSLKRKNHLEILAEKGFDGIIFATDRILKDCLEQSIIPDYVLIADGSEKILDYINHDIVHEYASKIGAIMCTITHPSVVEEWKGEIYWFINFISQDIHPNIGKVLQSLLKKTMITTAGHVSSLGWGIGVTIGCNPIVLIGVDLSYPEDVPMEQTWYYSGYEKRFKGNKERIRSVYKHYHHNFFNTDCYYDPFFDAYITCSLSHFNVMSQKGLKIINCTGGGAIEGKGVECMNFDDYLESNQNRKKG